ncbi:MAG TPA: response regulator transcription factor [Actinomycetota bacterium]
MLAVDVGPSRSSTWRPLVEQIGGAIAPGKKSPRTAGRSATPRKDLPSVMLVDDHPMWRQTLRDVVEQTESGVIVAESGDGKDAVAQAKRIKPQVIVMDVHLPSMNGIEVTRTVAKMLPETRILVLSSSDDRTDVIEAVRAGASGYVVKTEGSPEIASAVRRVFAGELVFPASVAGIVLEELRSGATTRKSNTGAKARPSKETSNVFRREGDYWTLSFGAAMFRARDSRGLRYVAHLLASPHREFQAMELVAVASRRDRTESAVMKAAGASDAGEVLDQKARTAYRRRIEALTQDAEEAESFNDFERASQAREEIDRLVAELARAVGLGGRSRRAASDSERARVAVRNSITAAVKGIARHDAGLARHLQNAIRTGVFCSYVPDRPVDWRL